MTIDELEAKWKAEACEGCMFCMKCVDEDGEPNYEQFKCFRWFLEHEATPEEQDIAWNAGVRFERAQK